jgi:hypothetical protein
MPNQISKYLAEIGRKGGQKGGKATGPRKARSPEHYAKMVEARNKQRQAKAGSRKV